MRTEDRGWSDMNRYRGPRKGLSSSSAPTTNMMRPRPSSKPPHVDQIRISHFSRPFREPLCSALRDAQMVGAMQEFEPHRDNCLATCRLVPRKWHSHTCSRGERKRTARSDSVLLLLLGGSRRPPPCAMCGRWLRQGIEAVCREPRTRVTSSRRLTLHQKYRPY